MKMVAGHRKHKITTSVLSRYFIGVVLIGSLLLPTLVYAGKWRVAPVHVILDRRATSCVITLSNDGEETVNLQGKAMEWSQDEVGKDVYQDTGNLLFFPRILKLEKGEQKIVRAGIRVPAEATEKTYRLFLEEIPQARTETSEATQLTVLVRFGIPVFAKPVKEELGGELISTTLENGTLSALITNTGNTHFRIKEITVSGSDSDGRQTFTEKLNGWYLLAGASRLYSLPIPASQCSSSKKLDIVVATDTDVTINRSIAVEKDQCRK